MSDDNLAGLAAEAYLYGFPLVFNLEHVEIYVTTGLGSNPRAPFNTFSHARTLATAADTFVSINNDTVYSMASIDLGVGPVRLRVPDTRGRYYVLQFVDAWTNNFAYVGHRATGTAAGEFLLVPPDWTGDAPGGVTVIRFPTRIGSIVGRWACDGVDDLPSVHLVQDATVLEPEDPAARPEGLPAIDPQVPAELAFLEKLRVYAAAFPPAGRDLPRQEALGPLGLGRDGDSPFRDHPAAADLVAGLARGKEALEAQLRAGAGSTVVNGWALTFHVFDYNLDFFEVGALDHPDFKISDPERRILVRAASALGGLWGNHAYEAAYVMTYVDGDGDPLTGRHTYTLTLDPPPPVGAFWSVTMYSVPDFLLVANPIDRYSVGDRTPGLVRGENGSVTITIAAERPADATAAANWLPAPAGAFRPLLRMYEPYPTVVRGDYVIPPVRKVAEDRT